MHTGKLHVYQVILLVFLLLLYARAPLTKAKFVHSAQITAVIAY